MANYLGFRTIDEIANYTYNRTPDELMKAGFTTNDPGIGGNYNPLYGAMVWANFNLEANVFSLLPKFPYDLSGFRIYSGKAPKFADKGTNNNSGLGGTVEGGLIADSVRPDVEEVAIKPKTIQYAFESTEVLEQLIDNSRDDHFGSLAQQRIYAADQFKEFVNQQLLLQPVDVVATDKVDRLNIESLDRIVSSNAEYLKESHANVADNYDPWTGANGNGIDRTKTAHDSLVVSPSGTIGTTDVLTNDIIINTEANLRAQSGKEYSVIVTGQNTYPHIQSLFMEAYRILNTADMRTEFSVGVNGVNTFTGTGAGLHISTLYGKPVIPTKDINNSGDVGDILMLNTGADKNAPAKPLIGLSVLKPIVYYEAGRRQQNYPFVNDAFNDRALYNALLELVCVNFVSHAKIRDIKSAI